MWFKLANPRPAHPALSVPVETTVKALVQMFPHSLCLPTDSPCGPAGHGMPPSLEIVGIKLSFQWLSSPDLFALPFLSNNKTYIKPQPPLKTLCTIPTNHKTTNIWKLIPMHYYHLIFNLHLGFANCPNIVLQTKRTQTRVRHCI